MSLEMRKHHLREKAQSVQDLAAQLQAAMSAGHEHHCIQQLRLQLDDAEGTAAALKALDNLEAHYKGACSHADHQQSQHLWDQLPRDMHDLVEQRTTAWLALRARYLFTGSSAFALLLCGAGGSQQFSWMPAYRSGTLLMWFADMLVRAYSACS